MIENKS